jgi:acyl-CoA synthetase (AMP-forming)/AMP-acid ligase II
MVAKTQHFTVADLLADQSEEALAISAIDRPGLTYGAFKELAADSTAKMNSFGIGRGDRVAIVLPNGPEMATSFVSLSAGLTIAPLNPAYRAEEFDFYLSDLGAKALVVADDHNGPALEVARKLGVSIIRLSAAENAPAGQFTLDCEGAPPEGQSSSFGMAGEDDVALVLHTSGTTSRPKIVPLLHRNVTASAAHIVDALSLTPADHCLNVMPLFHIHGLIAAVLASLASGSRVTCTPGFNALQFFSWLREAKPTWYTAVPTMHQAILSRAARNSDAIASAPLRFIRSSSASLPPQVMTALEETFSAPVIESYGMTEASHQMASNPLPPAVRKAGSVGIPTGPQIRLADPDYDILLPMDSGKPGEVVISGPNVTPGYEANPEANEKAFFEAQGFRWFRTGDQGTFDSDSYLRITGRLKEIINRGGEKVSPLEVDEILLDHPAVAQVVTFALPHDKLGEEVAAAIVLAEGASASENDIRSFAARRLADFKVPRKLVFLDEIPKGATGKMQRIGMAEKLGLTS